jgi:type I restriction enzyme, R subunit
VRDDYGKLFFNILDYTGSATTLFADSDFDGDPTRVSEEEIDEEGKPKPETYKVDELEPMKVSEPPGPPYEGGLSPDDEDVGEPRKYYFDGGQVQVAAHLVYELDPEGKQLRVVQFTDYTAERVRTLFPTAAELREAWADPEKRADIIERLAERGIDFDELTKVTAQPDADPFDLLCHVAYSAPLKTRRERADRVRKERREFLGKHSGLARQVLEELLEKYAEHGAAQFVLPDVLQVPPISDHGNVIEIAKFFGGAEKLRDAIRELQTILYAA